MKRIASSCFLLLLTAATSWAACAPEADGRFTAECVKERVSAAYFNGKRQGCEEAGGQWSFLSCSAPVVSDETAGPVGYLMDSPAGFEEPKAIILGTGTGGTQGGQNMTRWLEIFDQANKNFGDVDFDIGAFVTGDPSQVGNMLLTIKPRNPGDVGDVDVFAEAMKRAAASQTGREIKYLGTELIDQTDGTLGLGFEFEAPVQTDRMLTIGGGAGGAQPSQR